MKSVVAILLLVMVPVGAGAQTSYSVVNSGATAYLVGGQSNPSLTLTRGLTYTFNVNATGHPFYIKTARVTGTGSQYSTGVTGQGAMSSALVFVVPQNAPNTLYYQCGVHGSMGGTLNIMDPLDVPGGAPGTLWLAAAVPNPTREGVLFRFGLPRPAPIGFSILDPRGREIRSLASGAWPAGDHVVRWDGRDRAGHRVPSGLYLYRLRVEGRFLSRRLVVTR